MIDTLDAFILALSDAQFLTIVLALLAFGFAGATLLCVEYARMIRDVLKTF